MDEREGGGGVKTFLVKVREIDRAPEGDKLFEFLVKKFWGLKK